MRGQIYNKIPEELTRIGAKSVIISIDNADKIIKLFTEIIGSRPYSKEFSEIYLKRFKSDHRGEFPEAKSIIIVVYPQFITEVKFAYKGKNVRLLIPPTYIYRYEEKSIREILLKILAEDDCLIKSSSLPEKLTTVLSGLGKYGRNNLCYVKGMGSFNTPLIFLSDLPVEKTMLSEMSFAGPCKNCTKCVDKCPTGAINKESFVINPEVCITYFNENEFEIPDRVLSKWRGTIVGCMFCQEVCPMNKKLLNSINRDVSFTEAETDLILQITQFKVLPPQTREKITRLCMDSYYEVIPRNLKVLLDKHTS